MADVLRTHDAPDAAISDTRSPFVAEYLPTPKNPLRPVKFTVGNGKTYRRMTVAAARDLAEKLLAICAKADANIYPATTPEAPGTTAEATVGGIEQ